MIGSAYALRYTPTGKWIDRATFPRQLPELTVRCLYTRRADASFARSEVSVKRYYDCPVSDVEIVLIEVTLLEHTL